MKFFGWTLLLLGIGMLIFSVIASIDESQHGGIQENEKQSVMLFIGLAIAALVGGLFILKKKR